MQWSSWVSRNDSTVQALNEGLEHTTAALEGSPDLVFVFLSRHHANRAGTLPSAVRERFSGCRLVGCSSRAVIGNGEEVEDGPALSVAAARLPGVRIDSRHVSSAAELADFADDTAAFIVMIDSLTTNPDPLIAALEGSYPGVPKIGGFLSGGRYPDDNVLLHDDGCRRDGAIVVGLSGDVVMDTIVAQGCRPIGSPLTVSKRQGDVILEFEEGRPVTVLQALFETLPEEDRRLFPDGLHIGLRVDGPGQGYHRGQFLLRMITGIDPNSGTISVGETLREGEVVQFHLRDASTSADDLSGCLDEYMRHGGADVRGALHFCCISRGVGLYGTRDFDSNMLRGALGPVSTAGFFCSGEIGYLGGKTSVHAYTSTFALFRPRAIDGRAD